MGSPEERTIPPDTLVPRGGLQWMGLILVSMALLAIYANVQKARRGQIETVTIAPVAPTPTPLPARP